MSASILGNFGIQTKFGSFLCGPVQQISLCMSTSYPCRCIATCMRYGEKTVFPFADDIAELFLHRHRSDKTEERKCSGKKDFKIYKGGLNIRYAMLRSHIAADSAIFKLNKVTPLVLMTVTDPNYQPVMEELCSAERYIDAEIVHRRMIGDRLLNGYSSPSNISQLKLLTKPNFSRHARRRSTIEFLKDTNRRTQPQSEKFQSLANQISRTKRLAGKDFNPFSIKRYKLVKTYGTNFRKSSK